MDITPEEKQKLRAKIRDAIGAGMEHGVPPESPPLPPTRERLNQAAYWAMGEVENFLTRKKWNAQLEREALEEQVRLLKEEVKRLGGAPA